jgi:hypothetical protein
MRDSELTERPGRGWSRWQDGIGEYDIERVWWQAKVLHFAKLKVLKPARISGFEAARVSRLECGLLA